MSEAPVGIVVTVFRGGCEVAAGDGTRELRLAGKHAHAKVELAVGDDVTFDPEKGVVRDVLRRRTRLVRRRPRDDPRREHVVAANMDRLAIVASVASPAFRAGAVDRFLLAALAGGLEAILVANKVDLLGGAPLPEEIAAYATFLRVFPVSATSGEGLEELRAALAASRTVLAGHSGVGKSSLLNALAPELGLEIGALRRDDRGRHTTTRTLLVRLPGDAIVVDTPGLREIGTGPVALELVDRAFPDVAAAAARCRFRNCRHEREPGCAVALAVDSGAIPFPRVASWQRLRDEARHGEDPRARRG